MLSAMPVSNRRLLVAGVLSALAPLVVFSCVAPKASKEAETAKGTAAATVAAAPKTPPPEGKLMVWDGDENKAGKSWMDCSKKAAGCKSVVEPTPDAGRIGAGLKFHVEGPDWAGFGWNWHGFYPETAGTDVTGYDSVSFWIRVEAKDKAKAPDPANLKVIL